MSRSARSEGTPRYRGADKLAGGLDAFAVPVEGRVAADLGCNVGGFTSELLARGAARVHAVDTGHGMLAAALRNDPRVVVHERTNALHVDLGEPCSLVVIDVAWTTQRKILPAALALLRGGGGDVLSLLKPHYEADPSLLVRGVLAPADAERVAEDVCRRLVATGIPVAGRQPSPLRGAEGNVEFWIYVRGVPSPSRP